MTHGNQVTVAFFRGSPEYRSAFDHLCKEVKLGATSLLENAVREYAENHDIRLDLPRFAALSTRLTAKRASA